MADEVKQFMAKFNAVTKTLLGVILGLGAILQVPVVQDFLKPILAEHPHLSTLVVTIGAIALLLRNPQVQHAIEEVVGDVFDDEPAPTNPPASTEGGVAKGASGGV